jgi:hypothetical protein
MAASKPHAPVAAARALYVPAALPNETRTMPQMVALQK